MDFNHDWNTITTTRTEVAGELPPTPQPAKGLQTLANWSHRRREQTFEELKQDQASFKEFLSTPTDRTSRSAPSTYRERVNEIVEQGVESLGADTGRFTGSQIETHLFEYGRVALAASYVVEHRRPRTAQPHEYEGTPVYDEIKQVVPQEMLNAVAVADIQAVFAYNERRELEAFSVDDFIDTHDDTRNLFAMVKQYDRGRLETVEEFIKDSGVTQPIRTILRIRLKQRRALIGDAIVEYAKERGHNPLIQAATDFLEQKETEQAQIESEVEALELDPDAVHELSQRVRAFEAEMEELDQRVNANELAVADAREELHSKLDGLEQAYTNLGTNLRTDIQELEEYKTDLKAIRDEVREIASSTARTEVNNLENLFTPQIQAVEEQLAELEAEIESRELTEDRIERELSEIEHRIDAVETEWETYQERTPAESTPVEDAVDAATARLWEENWLERVRTSVQEAAYAYVPGEGTLDVTESEYVWASTELKPGISEETRQAIRRSGSRSLGSFPLRQRITHRLSRESLLGSGETLLEIVPVVYTNPEAYIEDGAEEHPAGVNAITEMLDTIDHPPEGVEQIVAIASMTGWSDHAIKQVEEADGPPRSRAIEGRHYCLVDLQADKLYGMENSRVLAEHQQIISHETREDEVQSCQDDVEAYLKAGRRGGQPEGTHGISLAEAVDRFDYTPDVVHEAFWRVAREHPDYELQQLEQGLCLVSINKI